MYIFSVNTVSDTLHAAAGKAEDTGWIMEHVLDGRYLEFPPFGNIPLPEIHLFGLDISITRHVVFMWIAALLLITGFRGVAAKAYKKSRVPKGVSNVMEVLILFVRDEIAGLLSGKDSKDSCPICLQFSFLF